MKRFRQYSLLIALSLSFLFMLSCASSNEEATAPAANDITIGFDSSNVTPDNGNSSTKGLIIAGNQVGEKSWGVVQSELLEDMASVTFNESNTRTALDFFGKYFKEAVNADSYSDVPKDFVFAASYLCSKFDEGTVEREIGEESMKVLGEIYLQHGQQLFMKHMEKAQEAYEQLMGEDLPNIVLLSAEQKAALDSAERYLSISAFSREGLIGQLEYEKYTNEDAVIAVDQLSVDWKEQAVKSAKSYLSISAFSYSGLIDQLEFDGFSEEEATYGADHCGADWKEQAAKSATHYMSIMSFSRQGLIDQLMYEGFTQEEADYGVTEAGLE